MPQLELNPTSSEAYWTQHLKIALMPGDLTFVIVGPFHLWLCNVGLQFHALTRRQQPQPPSRWFLSLAQPRGDGTVVLFGDALSGPRASGMHPQAYLSEKPTYARGVPQRITKVNP